MKISVFSEDKPESSQFNGRTYWNQRVWVHIEGSRYPVEARLTVADATGYAQGEYQLELGDVSVRDRRIKARFSLSPLKAPTLQPARSA